MLPYEFKEIAIEPPPVGKMVIFTNWDLYALGTMEIDEEDQKIVYVHVPDEELQYLDSFLPDPDKVVRALTFWCPLPPLPVAPDQDVTPAPRDQEPEPVRSDQVNQDLPVSSDQDRVKIQFPGGNIIIETDNLQDLPVSSDQDKPKTTLF